MINIIPFMEWKGEISNKWVRFLTGWMGLCILSMFLCLVIFKLFDIPVEADEIRKLKTILQLLIPLSITLAGLIAVMFSLKWRNHDDNDNNLTDYRKKFFSVIEDLFIFSGLTICVLLLFILIQNIILSFIVLITCIFHFLLIMKGVYQFIIASPSIHLDEKISAGVNSKVKINYRIFRDKSQ